MMAVYRSGITSKTTETIITATMFMSKISKKIRSVASKQNTKKTINATISSISFTEIDGRL